MLVRKRNEDSHSVSPFLYEGLAQKPQQNISRNNPNSYHHCQKIIDVEHLDVLVTLVKLSLAVV